MPRRTSTKPPGPEEEAIGRRIRALRKKRGHTQAQFAHKLGLTQALISHYERGAVRVHGALLADMARLLHTSTDEMLGLKPSESNPATLAASARTMRRLQRISELAPEDQRAVLKYLEALLGRGKPSSARTPVAARRAASRSRND
jgi:transcriptional regulator with XRE-family HTH domain